MLLSEKPVFTFPQHALKSARRLRASHDGVVALVQRNSDATRDEQRQGIA